ncbi:hypothetical protein IWZ03DRAFT_384088 [Phyllosticta citriasiana]|uniref:Mtf2-like C-terminal domain-containing protein n=1 Tax=Phyllosticta citriasiana TaxID=595635 RepID=A0ABR1KII5_9PEZI
MAASATAARRALAPLHSTLCPFLYRTRTILNHHSPVTPPRWRMQKRHLRIVNELGRVIREDDGNRQTPTALDDEFDFEIPFEDEKDRPKALHERTDTSVTATEREAFKKLFEEYASRAKDSAEDAEKDFEFSSKGTLDEILADALGPQSNIQGPGMTKTIPEQPKKKEKDEAPLSARYALLREKQQSQYTHVVAMFNAAQSDIELWNVLDREVFSIIRRLDLDAPGMLESAMDDSKWKSENDDAKISELEIIGPNYPTFLLHVMRQLRVDFPTSTLPMSLLPTVKSLGRESFALAVSTELYNELIAVTWLIFADFQGIDEILKEMQHGGIRFDKATFEMIRSIVYTARKIPVLQPGRIFRNEMRDLDRFDLGREKLVEWGKYMRERLDYESIQAARSERFGIPGIGDVI